MVRIPTDSTVKIQDLNINFQLEGQQIDSALPVAVALGIFEYILTT